MQKKNFIDQLKDGDRLDDPFLVKSARLAETRAGKPYLILTVADRTGEINGPVWDNAQPLAEKCQAGSFVRVLGMVQSYRDRLQLKVDAVERLAQDDIDPADFIAVSSKDTSEMAQALQDIVRTVQNPFIKKLLGRFFKKGDLWEAFQLAPAAKGIHHAYAGGLLEHCLSMARLADFLAGHYPGVDRSLLLAGALLHDIGKLRELEAGMGLIDYTPEGRLKGHLVIGSEMVAGEAAAIRDFPQEILTQIQHLILSHHGRQEFGSPAVPMTVEAFLLSQIDDMDAKMNLMEQLRRKMTEKGFKWSEYQRPLERYLYLSGLEREDGKEDPPELPVQSRQQTLF